MRIARAALLGDVVGMYRLIGSADAAGLYRAVHVLDSTPALIRIADHPHGSIELLRESCSTGGLRHPGLARILDCGVLADRRVWVASEVIPGVQLREILAQRKLATDEALALIRDAAEVLAYAHARGTVHRALTTHAIVLATGERGFAVCIADWADHRVTVASGAPPERGVFTAPELLAGHDGDARVDVYALGVIAYRAVAGGSPTVGLSDVRGASRELATLILRMLSVDPALRPTSSEVEASASRMLERQLETDRWPEHDSFQQAERLLAATPIVAEDRVLVTSPRFSRPKWTPAPAVSSEQRDEVSGEIDAAPPDRARLS